MECTPAELKSAYHRMCLQVHPDVSTRDRKSEKFVALRQEYEEAMALRKIGYVGALHEGMPPSYYSNSSSSFTSAGRRDAARHFNPRWTPHLHQQQSSVYHPYPVEDVIKEFDLRTRITGTIIVVTTLVLGSLALREFLVATAGSFWAYHYGAWSNFYIRRYMNSAEHAGLPDADNGLKRKASGASTSEFYVRRLNKGLSRAEKSRIDKHRGGSTPPGDVAATAAGVEAATRNDTEPHTPVDEVSSAPGRLNSALCEETVHITEAHTKEVHTQSAHAGTHSAVSSEEGVHTEEANISLLQSASMTGSDSASASDRSVNEDAYTSHAGTQRAGTESLSDSMSPESLVTTSVRNQTNPATGCETREESTSSTASAQGSSSHLEDLGHNARGPTPVEVTT